MPNQQIPTVEILPPLSVLEVLERSRQSRKPVFQLRQIGSPSLKLKELLLGLGTLAGVSTSCWSRLRRSITELPEESSEECGS